MLHYDTLEQFVTDLPILAEKARDNLNGHDGTFRLETTEGYIYEAEILPDGQLVIGPLSREPDCTIIASEKDLLAIISGTLNPAKALLLRKIRARGQVTRLMALIRLLG